MSDCIFCKIASKEMKSDLVWEGQNAVAFRDINPQAPTHILIIPKEHIPSIAQSDDQHKSLMGELILAARDIAKDEGITDQGYRLVFNNGENAGQAVFHIHLHLLGGRAMQWPPG